MKKLFIIFAILCLATPAMAADWNFYGSARFATFWQDLSGDTNNDADDDSGLQWAQQGNSRIGAVVKFNDQIGGGFEMSDSFGKRKLYGTYNFGNGSQLLIGQTYTPMALFYSNSVFDGDGDLLGAGEFYEGRLPMVQWKMGGLKVALITPNTEGYDAAAAVESTFTADNGVDQVDLVTTDAVPYDIDSKLPKIEVGYNYKADMFFVDVVGGYQTYKLDGNGVYEDYDVDAYVIQGGGGVNIGPMFIKAEGHFGKNLGNYGAYDPTYGDQLPELDDSFDVTNDKDAKCWGALGVIGFNLSEMVVFEGGFGHEEAEVDDSDNAQTRDQWYVNATINVAPGFFIVPEIGQIFWSEDATDPEPDLFYAGAKWQINF